VRDHSNLLEEPYIRGGLWSSWQLNHSLETQIKTQNSRSNPSWLTERFQSNSTTISRCHTQFRHRHCISASRCSRFGRNFINSPSRSRVATSSAGPLHWQLKKSPGTYLQVSFKIFFRWFKELVGQCINYKKLTKVIREMHTTSNQNRYD